MVMWLGPDYRTTFWNCSIFSLVSINDIQSFPFFLTSQSVTSQSVTSQSVTSQSIMLRHPSTKPRPWQTQLFIFDSAFISAAGKLFTTSL